MQVFEYFPIHVNLKNKKCLVVGGGTVAERKVKALLNCGAKVYVVSPVLSEWLDGAAEEGKIVSVRRNYTATDLEDAFLVVGATDNPRINSRVAEDCAERNILVNVVDNPAKCNFIVPAVFRQGPLCISVSTEGKSPMLARKIKEDLESAFGPEYLEFLELMAELREYILRNVPEEDRRRELFKGLVYSDIIDLLRDGNHEKVKERISHVLGSGWTQS